MKIAVFSTKPYDRQFLDAANGARQDKHHLRFFEPHLNGETVALAAGVDAVCAFVNDTLDAAVIAALAASGTRLIALRCAGFNNVDLPAARQHGLVVARVPAYSPHAVAEHAAGMILTLNRKFHRAFNRVREGNFSLDGLLGFDLFGKSVGVVGTGKIGVVFAKIMQGFGCEVRAHDPFPNPEVTSLGIRYLTVEELFSSSDILSLHCPLTPENHHLINCDSLTKMRDGVMLINTSRGGLIDTLTLVEALKSGKVGYVGLDVYEEESELFFEDLSNRILRDDVFTRLLTFPNVLITGHQAFFTCNAMENIAATTMANITEFEQTGKCANAVG